VERIHGDHGHGGKRDKLRSGHGDQRDGSESDMQHRIDAGDFDAYRVSHGRGGNHGHCGDGGRGWMRGSGGAVRLALAILVAQVLSAQTTFSGGVSVRNISAGQSSGGTLSVSVSGVTNTQAVLTYTAPDGNPCTVQASESNTLSPLVHDVDSTLFTGANSDARSSSVNTGTLRKVVLGARVSQLSPSDSNVYSRALQAFTTHYYQVTCTGASATGSFTTANIPLDSTYQDVPQLDPANPGATIVPTLTTSRTQTIVDPQTGALLRRVSLPVDSNYPASGSGGNGPYQYSGGFVRVCGESLIGPGPGYLCSFAEGGGGYGVLYYIIPSTGEARYLGYVSMAYPYINPIDSKFYTLANSAADVYQQTYNGNYLSASPVSAASFSPVLVRSGVPMAIHTFNAAFDATAFGCGDPSNPAGLLAIGDYIPISCRRSVQDSYGWVAILQISTGQIVAAVQTYKNPRTSWCTLHDAVNLYTTPYAVITTHQATGGNGGAPGLGIGPYTTTYTGGSTLSSGSTTLAVAGEPTCTGACGTDSALPAAAVGDLMTFSDNAETVTITTKNSSTSWAISATANTHAPGATLTANCSYTPVFWSFLSDPNGTDTTNANYKLDTNWMVGGHDDYTTGLRITESTGYPLVVGDLATNVGAGLTRTINNSPTFAGAAAQCFGDACIAHPSTAPGNTTWFTDFFGWSWAGQNNTLSNVSGQLYKNVNSTYPLYPKQHAIAAAVGNHATGPHSFLDVSGPGVTLGTTSADQYKMCIPNVAGECYPTSSVGDLYANMPGSPVNCGTGSDASLTPCFGDFGAYASAVIQVGVAPGNARVLTQGLSGLRAQNDYPTAKTLANGSYLLTTIGDVDYHPPSHVVMVKLPPFAAGDAVDRTTFVRAPISITTPQGQGIATATVEFGYGEQGTVAQHYCTSRREACVAVASTVTEATPFWYVSTDTYSRASCAASCTITLPVLPGHVAYWRVRFYNSGGVEVLVSPVIQGVTIEGVVN
jgi:hypothetical protein